MTDARKTDEELVELAVRQREFFGTLIVRYEKRLARYLRRLGVRDGDDVDDLLQEVFIKTYRNLQGFDTALSFSSWIYRIAHNEAVSWFRKRTARPEGHCIEDGEDVLALMVDAEAGQEAKADAGFDAEAVNAALKRLDAKYRDVLILRYFEHQEYSEISDILKMPVGSVGTLIHRAKRQLRSLLDSP